MKRSDLTRLGKSLLFHTGLVPRARDSDAQYGECVRVLAYHSVAPDPAPYCKSDIRVRPAEFEQQVKYLARHYQVLSLSAVSAILADGGRLPARAVVITFDDGYEDNYLYAYPLLARYGLVATFFVVSDAVLGRMPLWVAQLQFAIMKAPDLTGLCREFDLPVRAVDKNMAAQQEIINKISSEINRAHREGREGLLERAFRALDFDPRLAANIPQVMTPLQLREMADAGMSIGSHSATHAILTSQDALTARAELAQSKQDIETLLGRAVDHFAFPNGPGVDNFSTAMAQLAGECGYRTASTSMRGVLSNGRALHAIPRLNIGEAMSLAEFAFKLEEHRFARLLFDIKPVR